MIWSSVRLDDVSLKFVPRDVWVGLFVGNELGGSLLRWRTLYLCFLPCLPLCVVVTYRVRPGASK